MKTITQPETGATIYVSRCGRAEYAFRSMCQAHEQECRQCRQSWLRRLLGRVLQRD